MSSQSNWMKRAGPRWRSAMAAAVGGSPPPAIYAADTFTRADSGTLGTSSSGHVWTQAPGPGALGIASNRAYLSNGASSIIKATLNDGIVGGLFQVKLVTIDNDMGVLFRYTDVNNFWLAAKVGGNIVLQHYTAGLGDGALVNTPQAISANDTIGVRVTGNSIQVRYNGANFGTAQTSALEASATAAGIYFNYLSGAGTFDDYVHSA